MCCLRYYYGNKMILLNSLEKDFVFYIYPIFSTLIRIFTEIIKRLSWWHNIISNVYVKCICLSYNECTCDLKLFKITRKNFLSSKGSLLFVYD